MKIYNIKEEMTNDMEKPQKKEKITNTKHNEVHSRRLKQAEDRISELEDEMKIKGKSK
jgi:hypothetical protein